jgi:kinase suppressor of Ras 2
LDLTGEENVDEIIKEWCIPSKSIQFKEKIGESRIGEIHKGHWHGEVLIYTYTRSGDGRSKHPNMVEFTRHLAQLTKVRHENIMLFMGACIEPNHMSVITSMQKGLSLHDTLYVKQRSLTFPAKLNILRQVAQAMGYLHARGIVHGKISSNNIIVENKVKICLMDQGVNSRLPQSNQHMLLPRRHLTYLSPELIRSLCVFAAPNYHIAAPFTKESDTYAFG